MLDCIKGSLTNYKDKSKKKKINLFFIKFKLVLKFPISWLYKTWNYGSDPWQTVYLYNIGHHQSIV